MIQKLGDFLHRLGRRANKNYEVAVVIFMLVFAVYLPCINGGFIWDDHYLIGQNPLFRSPVVALEVFRHPLYVDKNVGYYRPVQNLSYMLDYCVFGGTTFAYHISNIAIHALAAFLVFLLLKRILPRLGVKSAPGMAALIACIWAIHPIHNAAVAYISGRADSLAAIFAVGAWLLHDQGRLTTKTWRRVFYFTAAAASFLLALFSKEIAITWAVIFILATFAVNRDQPLRGRVLDVLGLLAVFGIYLGFRLSLPGYPMKNGATILPWFDRLCLANRAWGDYVGLIFCPIKLRMERLVYINSLTSHGFLDYVQNNYLVYVGLLSLAATSFMLWLKAPGRGLRAFGMAWFVLGFLPISNLFPLNAQAAEHWIYMPSIGFLIFVAGCIVAFPRHQTVLTGIAFVAMLPLGIRTGMRASEWTDECKFFEQTLRASGYSLRPMHNMLRVLLEHKEEEKAVQMMKEMTKACPNMPPLRQLFFDILTGLGRNKEAAEYKTDLGSVGKAVSENQDVFTGLVGTFVLKTNAQKLSLEGKYDEALKLIGQVPAEKKNSWEIQQVKIGILALAGQEKEAIGMLKTYTDDRWWDYAPRIQLARLQYSAGLLDDALKTCAEAASLDVWSTVPLSMMMQIYEQQKNLPAAIATQRKVLARNRHSLGQLRVLAALLKENGENAEGDRLLETAKKITDEAKQNIGVVR